MATSNFLQFNPSAQNQETDAAYLADPQRTGGATVGATFPSPLANKLFFQGSTFVAAFAAMMAAKGYAMADTNLATLQAALANVRTNADELGALNTITTLAGPAYDASAYNAFQGFLNGNLTAPTISGQTAGQVIRFAFQQDNTGGRTVAWPAGTAEFPVIDPTPNAWTVADFFVTADLQLRLKTSQYAGSVSVPGGGIGAYSQATYDTGVPVPAGFHVVGNVTGDDPHDGSNAHIFPVSFAINNAGNFEVRIKNITGGGGTSYTAFTVSYRLV